MGVNLRFQNADSALFADLHVHSNSSLRAWRLNLAWKCKNTRYEHTQPKIIGLDSILSAIRHRIEDEEELESSM